MLPMPAQPRLRNYCGSRDRNSPVRFATNRYLRASEQMIKRDLDQYDCAYARCGELFARRAISDSLQE